DGHADILLGAPSQTAGGYAVVFSGATGTELFRYTDVADTGFSVAYAGDWNGDGVDDVAIGNPGINLHGSDSGKASVISGKDGSTLIDFIGTRDLALFGCALGGGHDV